MASSPNLGLSTVTGGAAEPPATSRSWFERNTHHWAQWSLDDLLAAKAGHAVSLVVPARNEAATVGDVVGRVREALMDTVALLDEIVVIDSDSTDDTYAVATDAGAVVHRSAEIRPDLGTDAGQGRGDVEVAVRHHAATCSCSWTPTSLDWDTHFVPGLLGPLLTRPEVALVKGFYERPLLDGGDRRRQRGLRGRPGHRAGRAPAASRCYWPELAGLVQPLAGEWAVRRSLFESLAGADRVRRRARRPDRHRGAARAGRDRPGRPRPARAPAPGAARPRRDGDPDPAPRCAGCGGSAPRRRRSPAAAVPTGGRRRAPVRSAATRLAPPTASYAGSARRPGASR